MLNNRREGIGSAVGVLLPAVLLLTGCPANLNRVPGSTEKLTERQTGGEYYLYVPSWHTNDQHWPLVITCHGTEPFDSAEPQIREWRGLAERMGFLVASPHLSGTNGMPLQSKDSQIHGQQTDERLILNIVRKAIGTLNADPDRVYLVGWSGGGYAVYYTGLRNPGVFRALAVRMGTFKKEFLPGVESRFDPYQPVGIFFGATDPLVGINPQCRAAYEYIKSLGGQRVTLREITGSHRRRPDVAFEFFKDVTEMYSYVRLNAVTSVGGDPLAVQFYLKIDPPARAVLWDFGDGTTGTDVSPRHRYSKPGSYVVTVRIVTARGARTQRQTTIVVGQ